MKKSVAASVSTTLSNTLSATLSASVCLAAAAADSPIEITAAGEQAATRGAASYFVGDVYVSQRFQGGAPARVGGGVVSFAPGARTAWHTHPLGQTLYVIAGVGRVQKDGAPVQEIRPGDVVWIPAGVKHWHGAAPGSAMSHLAFAEQLDGEVVTWLEQVSEAQYTAPVRP